MGRPTDNPKPYHMTVKYDEECKEILEQYCKQEQVPRMEAARRGIKKLKDDLKKWWEAALSYKESATSPADYCQKAKAT